MKSIEIKDTTKINDYKEVDKVELSTITKNDGDKEILSGLLLYGYEMKFGAKNENQEVYTKDSITNYIEKYFVKNKLNIPVDLQHRDDFENTVGRVLVVEVNSVGFYFVVYIPKTEFLYQRILDKVKEGILQGFSKYGWATDYEYIYLPDGTFDYMLIKEMAFTSLSIVAIPANSLPFEKIAQTKVENSTKLVVEKNKVLTIEDELF